MYNNKKHSRVLQPRRAKRLCFVEAPEDPSTYIFGKSSRRNSNTLVAGSVRIGAQGLACFSSKPSPENIASSRPAAPGSPRGWCWATTLSDHVERPRWAGEIFKRNNHRPFWRETRSRTHYHEAIVFEKFRSIMFSVHTKTQSRRFQILTVWRAFSISSVFAPDGLVLTIGLNPRHFACLSDMTPVSSDAF